MKLNVGCGPAHRKEGWVNIDIRPFPGVDMVRDATESFADLAPLEYVYAEHFLEHLPLEGAIKFLRNSAEALAVGGRIRLSTPCLEWASITHFDPFTKDMSRLLEMTFTINRAFHGWGHQFLWSRPMIEETLRACGYEGVGFYEYGVGSCEELSDLEQHGGYKVEHGFGSVWIVEASRPHTLRPLDPSYLATIEDKYVKYVRSGH